MQLTGFVRERARESVRRDDALADLVADKDLIPGEACQAVEERVSLPLEVRGPWGQQKIGEPQRQAFDDDDATRARRCAKRIGEANGFLNDRPLGRASRPVCGNPYTHLVVIGGSGDGAGVSG